jgi:hypothetical protein
MSREVITVHGAASEKYHLERCRVIQDIDESRLKNRSEEYASAFWGLCDVCRQKEELRQSSPVGE